MKYTDELIEKVLEDFENGKNKSQLEKEYNISRSTIRYWIDNKDTIFLSKITDKPLETIIEEIKNNKETYNYILGLYLGDGCISRNKMSYKLRITQDNKYPKSIELMTQKLNKLFNSSIIERKGCKDIVVYDKNLPLYFPQHDTGKKHDRPIILSDYQRENIDYLNLMSGLWMSDGSYYIAQKKYECYNFTNKSTDIISLFEECLNYFNVSYRKRVKKNGVWLIEITKKSEVSKMKELVGIKT